MDILPTTGGKHRLKSTTRSRLHNKRSITHLSRTKLTSTPASPTTSTNQEKLSIDPKPSQQASYTLSTASFIRHSQEQSSNLRSLGRPNSPLPRNGGPLVLTHWKDQETRSSSSVDSRLQVRTTSLASGPKTREQPTKDPSRPSDQEIERRFRLASKDYLHTNLVDISNLSNDRKWWLLCNQKEFTKLFSNTKKKQAGLTRARSRTNLKDNTPKILTPQTFLRPFLAEDRSGITLRLVKDLENQLRISSLGWIRQFIEEKGMRIIIRELGMINNRPTREQKNYLIELGIIRCLRPMFNHIVGIQEALSDPFCSIHLILSLLSPYIPARTAACDALTFLCYCDVPTGHSMVLRGMDHLKECSHAYGRFDSWLNALDDTLDDHGKMGSLVGANKDLWQTEVIGTPSSPEAHLMEYALSNMLLVNAILAPDTVEDLDIRIAFRNQLHQSGLSQIIEKMNGLNYEKLNEKVREFRDLEEDDSTAIYGGLVVDYVLDPIDILDKLLATIRGTRSYDSLQNILQHLLLIQCDPEKRNRYYQLIDSIVCEIVLDHKGSPQDFLDDYTSSVHDMISRYTNDSPSDEALEESSISLTKSIEREKELQRQINLGAGGLVGQLNCKIDSLEEALKASNLANIALKQRLSDLETEFQNTLEATDAQIKRLYDTVREQKEYGSPTDKRRRFRVGRKPKTDGDTRPLSLSSILMDEPLQTDTLTESPIEVTNPCPPTQSQSQPNPQPQPNPSSGGKQSLRVSIGSRMSKFGRRSTQPEISPVPAKSTSPKINSTVIEGSLPPQAKLRYSEDQLPEPSATKSTSLLIRRSNRTSHPGRSRLSDSHSISNVKEEEPLSAIDTVDMLLKKLYEDSDHDNTSFTSIGELLSAPTTPLITPAATSSAESTGPTLPIIEPTEESVDSIEHPTIIPTLQDTLDLPTTSPNSPTIIFSTSDPLPDLPVVVLEPPPPPPAPPAPPPPPPPPPPPSTPFMSPSSSLLPPQIPPPMMGMVGRKSSSFQAKQKLKFVEWEKVTIPNISQTVWAHSEKDGVEVGYERPHDKERFDFQETMEFQLAKAGVFETIEDTFVQKPAVQLKIKRTKEFIYVLEPKKSYNLNIFVTSVCKKIAFGEIRQRLISMDFYFEDEQVLSNLLRFLPTPEETGKLAPYVTAPLAELIDLSPPDKFCLEMMKIDRLKERLECMLFRSTFWDRYHQLHKQMTSMFDASLSLKNGKRFKELLHLILLLGNYLNGNTYRGGAFAVRIASINKLVDTKGTNTSTTLLHFLIETVEQNFPEMADFLEELEECGEACKVSGIDMNNEFRDLESGLTQLGLELKNNHEGKPSTDSTDRFADVMGRFHTDASAQFKRIFLLKDTMNQCYESMVRYYGEDPNKMCPDEFFGIFKKFTSSWEKCAADNNLAKQKKERLEKQKMRDQERRTRGRSASILKIKGVEIKSYGDNDEEKAIMDSLMDSLRTSGTEQSARIREERRTRKRSGSILSLHTDSVSLRAQRMLQNIQNENSTNLTDKRRSAIIDFNFDLKEEDEEVDGIYDDIDQLRSAPVFGPTTTITTTPATAPIGPYTPKPSRSSQSTRIVRTRKTSKRPIFDHTIRVRGRRMTVVSAAAAAAAAAASAGATTGATATAVAQ
ncbi:hypothetical protein CLU79DRAFT_755176 [Phycomyces nitens]|nr:hypothetical protein CLU79DRAFT_755176 [Phycomyces nitens]